MSDTRIQAIRERLEAATPGPWAVSNESPYAFWLDDTIVDVDGRKVAFTEGMIDRGRDAEFIANAPADIAYLLSLLELADRARAVEHRVNW